VQRIEGSRRTEDGPLRRMQIPVARLQRSFPRSLSLEPALGQEVRLSSDAEPSKHRLHRGHRVQLPRYLFPTVQRRNPSLSACFVTLMSLRDSARLGVRLRAAKRVPVTCCEPLYRTQGAQGSSCVLSSNIHSQRQFALANTTSTLES